jgi:hypothetical protein
VASVDPIGRYPTALILLFIRHSPSDILISQSKSAKRSPSLWVSTPPRGCPSHSRRTGRMSGASSVRSSTATTPIPGNGAAIVQASRRLPGRYAVPTRSAKQLTKDSRQAPIIGNLFPTIRPAAVFVHSDEPVRFFARQTGRPGFTDEVKLAGWQGHRFWLYGRPGPLYRARIADAVACGRKLAAYLGGRSTTARSDA